MDIYMHLCDHALCLLLSCIYTKNSIYMLCSIFFFMLKLLIFYMLNLPFFFASFIIKIRVEQHFDVRWYTSLFQFET
jgi:hypothetical protein